MKANANLKSRTKNSMIYFQLGLIGTMLVVLFVLEFQFKETVKKVPTISLNETLDEPFNTTYTIIEHKVVEAKPTKVVKPIVKVPKDVTKLEIKKNEELIKETEIKTQDDVASTEGKETKEDVVVEPNEGKTTEPKKEITFVNVEQLPMFPECAGLSRADQKACFDEQLLKAVLRNLEYPEADLRKGNQGRALIEFVIDERGYITNVKAINNDRATDNMKVAAEKAVKKLPKLIPAKQGKENVRIKYSIPISFRIK